MSNKYKKCVFAGSFDPITNGHEDVIKKASLIFESVTVAVLKNTSKTGKYTTEEREKMLLSVCKKYPNVTVKTFDGLLVDFLKKEGAEVFVRGVRNSTDFDYETTAHNFNLDMDKDLITLYFPCSADLSYVSSSRVKELLSFGKDVSIYVPKEIVEML